ncbi:MAG: AMP-binding protein [Lysobacterales bacterium]|jgi:acyl-CoA synthetase (AMP-forming)/AMP-acid ligase II
MKMNFSRIMGLLALRYGDREALVNVERYRRFTYRELQAVTNRIANMLRGTLGLERGDNMLMILDNDNLSLMHFPSTWKQEATAVYTNFRDSLEEHTWQVELAQPKVVFLESEYVERYYDMLRANGCTIIAMDPIEDAPEGVLDFWTLVNAASPEENDCELDVHEHRSMLRFTGGTTGRGKCAMYTIDACLGCRDGMLIQPDLEMNEDMRFLHFAPLSHGSSMFYYPALFVGGTSFTQNSPDLQQWRRVVAQEKITHSFLVPTLLYRLLDLQRKDPVDLGSLRTIAYGAAPINPARLGDLVDMFGSIFLQGYGATEAMVLVSALNKRDHHSRDEGAVKRLASAGRVTPGIEISVLDEDGNRLPPGETGELTIRCRSLIKGYYKNPEGTAAEFVDGAWRSGDLGYIDAGGYVFIVDRKKDMIISGGFNIYAVEVEAALGSHPAVQISAVVGIPHPDWGEAVHAEVILREGCEVTEQELMAHVKERLGGYKAPKSITLVQELPISTVGKVVRRQVREKYWSDSKRRVS